MDIKTVCRGVLSEQDLSGYEIKKLFESRFVHFFVAGFGSIYPALSELAQMGDVEVTNVQQEGKPDKKVYHLTEKGLTNLRDELRSARPTHKVRSEFLILMHFGHHLPKEHLISVLDEMINHFEAIMDDIILKNMELNSGKATCCTLPAGKDFTLGFGHAVLTSALQYCRNYRQIHLSKDLKNAPLSNTGMAAGE